MPSSTDGKRFGREVLPHLDAAYSLARWIVRDASLADDVVQDAVLRALGYFASFRGGNARAWLMRIVRNAAYDAVAARRGHGVPADGIADEVHDPAADPESSLAETEERAWLHRSVASLPADLRECLILRELEEFSYKEIAQIMDVPIGTVMSRLWRARQLLIGLGQQEAGS
jgi:RNA polymerase sigma-70 factor (ECF subfamily)